MPDNKVSKAIVCPMCGELGKAEIYTSVNPTVSKALRDKVLDGELFRGAVRPAITAQG